MTEQPFMPFSESMVAELKRQYGRRNEQYELLEKMRRSEMLTQDEYNQQKRDLDESIVKIEKIDREFHILS